VAVATFILSIIVISVMITLTALSSIIFFWGGVVFAANVTKNYESRVTQLVACLCASIPWIPWLILIIRYGI
jgi:hypothetical protein